MNCTTAVQLMHCSLERSLSYHLLNKYNCFGHLVHCREMLLIEHNVTLLFIWSNDISPMLSSNMLQQPNEDNAYQSLHKVFRFPDRFLTVKDFNGQFVVSVKALPSCNTHDIDVKLLISDNRHQLSNTNKRKKRLL